MTNTAMNQARREELIAAMKAAFGADGPRIDHALKVLAFAETILAGERADADIVVAAAILHDIGIQEAERKHHSAAGHLQEIEGPPIARRILEKLGTDAVATDQICRIVANHHSARDIDTPEFRIVWDADWLVNIPDVMPGTPAGKLREAIHRVFKTETGRKVALNLYGKGTQ